MRAVIARALGSPVVAGAFAAALTRAANIRDLVALDVSIYLTVARGWLDGLLPYRDLFDHKGPLAYALFAVVEAVVPSSSFAIRFALLLLFVVALAQLVGLVRRHAGPRTAWLVAVLFGMAGSSPQWDTIEPNAEQLALPALVAAVDLADRYERSGRLVHALGAGAMLGVLLWIKPQFVVIAPLVLVLLLRRPRRRLAASALVVAGAMLVTAVVLAPFATADGGLAALRDGLFTYNRAYANIGLTDLAHRSLLEQLAWLPGMAALPFTLGAVALGALAWIERRCRGLVAICAAWVGLEFLAAKLGVRDFPHYFQPLVPGLCVLAVLGAEAAAAHLTGLTHTGRLALAAAVWATVAAFLALGPARDRLASGAGPQPAVYGIFAGLIRAHTKPSDRIYVAAYDNGYQLYWLADRNPAARFFFPAIMGGPPIKVIPRYDLTVADLQRRLPAAVVIWPGAEASYLQPFLAGMRLIASIDDAKLYVRR